MEHLIKKNNVIYDKFGNIVFDGKNFCLHPDLFCLKCEVKLRNGKSQYCFDCQQELRSEAIKKSIMRNYARKSDNR